MEATCDRVIIINRGDIIADSRTSELTSSFGGGMKVSVQVGGADFDSLSSALSGVPGVTSVTGKREDGGLCGAVVAASPGSDVRPGIFTAVRDRGWILYEMTREQETLEHVFRELTKGGDNEIQ